MQNLSVKVFFFSLSARERGNGDVCDTVFGMLFRVWEFFWRGCLL
jgi:hypothetical protein